MLTFVDVGAVGLLARLGALLLLASGGLLAGILLLGSLGGGSRSLGGGLLVSGLGGHLDGLLKSELGCGKKRRMFLMSRMDKIQMCLWCCY